MVNGSWWLVHGRAIDHLKQMAPPTAAAQYKSFLAKFTTPMRAQMDARNKLVIKAVSAKQRPRRPAR